VSHIAKYLMKILSVMKYLIQYIHKVLLPTRGLVVRAVVLKLFCVAAY